MCEVVYWVEKLKRRWIAEETGERDDTDDLCQAEGEGGECFRASERHVDTEETQTGEQRDLKGCIQMWFENPKWETGIEVIFVKPLCVFSLIKRFLQDIIVSSSLSYNVP